MFDSGAVRPTEPDQRALQILFNTHWSKTGWRTRDAMCISGDDFAYAKRAGVMFDDVDLSHDDIVDRAVTAVNVVDLNSVVDAFVVSLSSRRLDLRSALGSFAVLQHFPPHRLPRGVNRCPVCGEYKRTSTPENLNVLNFERFKWGGVRHQSPLYAALDLDLFAQLAPAMPEPSDVRMLRAVLDAIVAAPVETTSASLEKHLAKVVKSNKAERDVLIGILGLCGILGTAEHPGYCQSFVPATARETPPHRFADMAYPACWWTRRDGVSQDATGKWFGHLL